MNKNPYNLIFGKEPPETISRIAQQTTVLNSFRENPPSQQIYMITGVRGSGKTVFMTEIAKELKREKEWIVVELNSSENLMKDLAASLGSENTLAKIFQNARINLSIFGIGLEVKGSVPISNIQVALTKMLESIKKHGKKVLVCIDEVTVTKYMKTFAGAFQILIRQDLPIYLLMTGLYENINNLQNQKNLTFLYRAPKLELNPLNLGVIANNYKKHFGLNDSESQNMANLTMGYPFAFQTLGYCTWNSSGNYQEALPDVQLYLEDFVYEKIWSGLSNKDKQLAYGIAKSKTGKANDIKRIANFSDDEYSVYRNRLIKQGIANGDNYGFLKFSLPFFDSFASRKNM